MAAHTTAKSAGAFTLAELLVSMAVLVILVFLATQLVNSAATVTILGHKLMDADSEARQVFDRMAIDFAQMVKRTDIDCYVKAVGQQTNQNDQIAFYSAVPGYTSGGAQSPLSLVAYRVNSNSASPACNKLERLGKGLVWNGAPGSTPMVFLPQTISGTWPAAVSSTLPDPDGNYEVIGPDVFRFEYFFILKYPGDPNLNGALKESPCWPSGCSLNGWQNVTAIAVVIAVIDPRSKVLLTNANITTLNKRGGGGAAANFLGDFNTLMSRPGALRNNWKNTLNSSVMQSFPHPAVAGIRVYERYFYLNQ